MTDKEAGPARVIENGRWIITTPSMKLCGFDERMDAEDACERINKFVAILSRKAALCERMAEGLKKAKEAMDVWLALYASEEMEKEHVESSSIKIRDEGPGTIGYIANKTKAIIDLLADYDRVKEW